MISIKRDEIEKAAQLASFVYAKHRPAYEPTARFIDKVGAMQDEGSLLRFFESLTTKSICELTALMWLGDGTCRDLAEAKLRALAGDDGGLSNYLVENLSHLPISLAKGCELLGFGAAGGEKPQL